ncbi:pregnancy-specific beta-1-glycoprotein 9 [Mus pahari]|uniref:pregnancy-specific beta-1-glycoprotein 9 n=1 Tax=Mus pahari TaxID=10093 RepID=UPI001114B896|nr:pregnancy-specific beta-1-glycoprotein 9 [Mus pahari]
MQSSWSAPATAQVTIEAVPPLVAEGKNVLLLVHNLPQALIAFSWFKGTTLTANNEIGRFIPSSNKILLGPAQTSRETIYSNGSILFKTVTKSDEGVYTLEMTDENYGRAQVSVRFYVHPSLLASWSPATTAQVTIEAVPPNVTADKNVLLLVHNLPQTLRVFYWYKGTTGAGNNEIGRFITSINRSKMGPAHSGRETIYSNGSLLFQSVTKNDEGAYTLYMLDQNFDPTLVSVRFYVHPSLLPSLSPHTTGQVTIEAVPPNVAEGKNVLLLVHNMPGTLRAIYWYKGTTAGDKNEIARFITASNKILLGPAHSDREIIYSNGSLFFQSVTKNDEGAYALDMLFQNFDHTLIPVRFNVHSSLLTIWNIPTSAKPTIESVPPAVLEGKDVLLLAHNLPDNLLAYHWFKGKRSIDKDLIIMFEIKSQETKQGKLYSGKETLYPNGSLMLQNVTLKQSGIYSLHIHSEDDQKSLFVEVFVYRK